MPRFAARIHVLLAAAAPIGLVFRRGPSKQVATFLWDRRNDEFHLGQWLKGRIYERRSDLSPDGKYAIYFAMNGKWKSESKGSWTAVSRAPYLKAICFYPKGDCWYGGGLWTGPQAYWLNGGHVLTPPSREAKEVRRSVKERTGEKFGGECLGVYYPRLLRDGWSLVERKELGKWKHQDIFEKSVGRGWKLRKIAHAEVNHPPGKGCYWDEHELVGLGDDELLRRPTWEWAELDGTRLVWAADGRLWAARVTPDGPTDEVELHDFNDMTFKAVEAPY